MMKTIQADTLQEMERQVNDLVRSKPVFATQTHIFQMNTYAGPVLQYIAVVFYRDPADYQK